ncbi:MAG: extracellular solute-binding protein [Ignavibacteriaceae bacterium]|nr:extracellular solute-binding protein [Ignavibacteriaceae bacterium]
MKTEKLSYIIIGTLLITVFVLVTYIFSPFGWESGEIVKVTKIYYVDNISEAHKKVIALFNKKYEGHIQVEAINLPFDKFSTNERKELLARFLRTKSDRIDVFAVDQIWVPRFAKWAIPVDSYLRQTTKKDFLIYAEKSCTYNDTLVAIPFYIDVALMYYRKDLIEKLPNAKEIKNSLTKSITWDEFIKLCKNPIFENNPKFVFQGDDYEGLICIFKEILSGLNGSLFSDQEINLNSTEVKKAVEFLIDLIYTYKISPEDVIRFKETQSYNFFVENDAIFLRGWPGMNRDIKDNPKLKNIVEPIPLPHFPESKANSVFGGWNLMVSKYSSRVQESFMFVNFLLTDEVQKLMYEEGTYLPINKSIYEDTLYTQKQPELLFYKKLLENGIHRPFLKNYTNVSDVLSFYINLALKKKLTVEEALHNANENINSQEILLK